LFQHELDHLDGVLLTEHLNDLQRKTAKKALRPLMLGEPTPKGNTVILADGTVQDA
jgi:peptide deformylase